MEKEYSPVLDIDMFPQKITEFIYPGDIQPFINKVYEIEQNYPNKIDIEFENFMYSPYLDVLHNIKEFFPLKQYIENLIDFHFNLDLSLQDSWLNIYKKGGYNPFHYHAPAILSGVFFLKIPPNNTRLFFHNKFNPTDKCGVPTQPGSILIFNGDQPHSTFPNPTDDEKIVISFNLK
jgi:hypothetical protein